VRFAQVGEEAVDAVGGASVSFDLTRPATFGGIGDELFFDAQPVLESGDVLRCGDELGAGQIMDIPAGSNLAPRSTIVRTPQPL
jgi:hypothetical protein